MRSFARLSGIFLVFVGMTLAMTWPLVLGLSNTVHDMGDPLLHTWVLHWDWVQLFRDPLHLFNANIFYPGSLTLAFSEHQLGEAIFAIPLFAAGLMPVTVYNIVYLTGMGLSGFAAWAFARELTGDGVAAVVAGIYFEFVFFQFDHVSHLELRWAAFLPLLLLFLWRFLRTRSWLDLVLFVVFFTWNGLANIYYGFFASLAVLILASVQLTRMGAWRDRRVVLGLLGGLGLSGILLAPTLWPYIAASRLYHLRRYIGEVDFYSAVPSSFLNSGRYSRWYGQLTLRFAKPECALFFGISVPVLSLAGMSWQIRRFASNGGTFGRRHAIVKLMDAVLALLVALRIVFALTGGFRIRHLISIHEPSRLSLAIAVILIGRLALAMPRFSPYSTLGDWIRRSPARDASIWGTVLTALGVALALGTHFFFYRELYDFFGFAVGGFRVPARGIVMSHIGLGVVATLGISKLAGSLGGRRRLGLTALLTGIVLFELIPAPLQYIKVDTSIQPWSIWLRSQPASLQGILELPMGFVYDAEYVYRTTEHGRSIVNGFSGFSPASYQELENAWRTARDFHDVSPLLSRMRASVILLHQDRTTARDFRRFPALLKEGIEAGDLLPAAMFQTIQGTTLAFEFHPLHRASRETSEPSPSDSQAIVEAVESPALPQSAPIGYLESPANGIRFKGTTVWGHGWAASEAGVAAIKMRLDGRAAGEVRYGDPREDVRTVFPEIPCDGHCGFFFHIENVAPGSHRLAAIFTGGNGKEYSPHPVTIQVGQ